MKEMNRRREKNIVIRLTDSKQKPVLPEDRPDDDLMLLSAMGRKDAFGYLVGRHFSKVRNYCAKFTGNLHRGEELTQEVFLQVWRNRRSYRSQGKFLVFLFRVTRNLCLNDRRWQKRHVRESQDGEEAIKAEYRQEVEANQLDALICEERRRRVRKAMIGLPNKLREALLLRFDQGMGYADMAMLLKCTEATLRSRVFHGLKRLRAKLQGARL